jgi:hypothetical protein
MVAFLCDGQAISLIFDGTGNYFYKMLQTKMMLRVVLVVLVAGKWHTSAQLAGNSCPIGSDDDVVSIVASWG